MKILMISQMYPSFYDLNFGYVMHQQVKMLQNKKYEVLVISPIPWIPLNLKYMPKKWKLYYQIPKNNVVERVNVYHPRYLSFPKSLFMNSGGIRMYRGIKKTIKKLWKSFQFDLIHTHMAFPDGYAGMLISKDYNKPLVVTFQATDLDITAKKHNCAPSLDKVFKYANSIISPSPRLNKQLLKEFNVKSNTIVYGIDPDSIFRNYSKIKIQYNKKYLILSVSRLVKSKGIEFNIYAIKELIKIYKQIIYLIIGDGPQRQYLNKIVVDLGLTKNVIFIGQLSREKVMEYMSICNLFSLPSYQETLGLVYLEAMAHGKPVIGVKGQGIDGIVKHKVNGMLIEPKNLSDLVKSIEYILNHTQEAIKMGEEAKKTVIKDYTWEQNIKKTIKVYQEVLRHRI